MGGKHKQALAKLWHRLERSSGERAASQPGRSGGGPTSNRCDGGGGGGGPLLEPDAVGPSRRARCRVAEPLAPVARGAEAQRHGDAVPRFRAVACPRNAAARRLACTHTRTRRRTDGQTDGRMGGRMGGRAAAMSLLRQTDPQQVAAVTVCARRRPPS